MWPSQVEALRNYSDLFFIDSTFKVNSKNFNAINIVVIDNHYRSILAATGLVKSEVNQTYTDLLDFVKKMGPKRVPLCMISDAARQIHLGASISLPYCRQIYCGFHLMREEGLFGPASPLDDATKDSIRKKP